MSTDVFEIDLDDVPPEILAAHKDSPPLACQHDGCGNGVVKPARGRTPKFCDEHKGKPAQSNRSATSGKSWPRAVEVENILCQGIAGVSMGLMLVPSMADDGLVLDEKMPAVIHELIELAKTDRRLRKYLEYLATPGKYAPLTLACISVVIPIMANHNLIPNLTGE